MSSLSTIPGISIILANENESGINLSSFGGTSVIPESHRYGNCLRISEINILNTIHEGSFGTIYKCRNKKNHRIFALKKFRINSADMLHGISSRILREINILMTFKHDNIANSHGIVAGDNLATGNYLLLDYCVTSLDDLLEKEGAAIYEQEMVKCIMKQLFDGLDFIHGNMVIHGNINCRNILFTENGLVKISGFQTAQFYSIGKMTKTPEVHEPMYTAPEILFETKVYATPIDIWSAGCVFARLLLKRHLFIGSDSSDVLISVFEILGIPSEAIWPGFTKECLDDGKKKINYGQPYSDLINIFTDQCLSSTELIQDMLIYYPPARKTSSEVLENAYFNGATKEEKLEELALIIRNFVQPAAPMETEE